MAFKYIAALALLAVANAGVHSATHVYHAAPNAHVYHAAPSAQVYQAAPGAHIYHAAPAAVAKTVTPVLAKADDDFDYHPQYKYSYNVQDTVSGDSKSQVEERDGNAVRGEYSLIDADGFKRTVHYTADDHNGFNAVVDREPLVKTIAPANVVKTPVAHFAPLAHYSAPTVVKHVAPEAHLSHYSAPTVVKHVAPVPHLAPVAHYTSPAVFKTVAPAYTTYTVPAYHH